MKFTGIKNPAIKKDIKRPPSHMDKVENPIKGSSHKISTFTPSGKGWHR